MSFLNKALLKGFSSVCSTLLLKEAVLTFFPESSRYCPVPFLRQPKLSNSRDEFDQQQIELKKSLILSPCNLDQLPE